MVHAIAYRYQAYHWPIYMIQVIASSQSLVASSVRAKRSGGGESGAAAKDGTDSAAHSHDEQTDMQGKLSADASPFSSFSWNTPVGTPRRTPPRTPRSELITQLDNLLSNLPVGMCQRERDKRASERDGTAIKANGTAITKR